MLVEAAARPKLPRKPPMVLSVAARSWVRSPRDEWISSLVEAALVAHHSLLPKFGLTGMPVAEKKKWIQSAIKHPGSFTKSANRAGKSVHEFAELKKHASGTLGRRARLALTLGKMRGK